MQKHGLKGYVVPHEDQHSVKMQFFMQVISLRTDFIIIKRANTLLKLMKDCTTFQDSVDPLD